MTSASSGRGSDPRAALAECWDEHNTAAAAVEHLAERGVRLVTEADIAAAIDRCMTAQHNFGLHGPKWQAAAIFAALSGEADRCEHGHTERCVECGMPVLSGEVGTGQGPVTE